MKGERGPGRQLGVGACPEGHVRHNIVTTHRKSTKSSILCMYIDLQAKPGRFSCHSQRRATRLALFKPVWSSDTGQTVTGTNYINCATPTGFAGSLQAFVSCVWRS